MPVQAEQENDTGRICIKTWSDTTGGKWERGDGRCKNKNKFDCRTNYAKIINKNIVKTMIHIIQNLEADNC